MYPKYKILGESNESVFAEQRLLPTNKSTRLLGPVAHLIKSKSKRFHRSLADIVPRNQYSDEVSLKLNAVKPSAVSGQLSKDQAQFRKSSGIRLTSSKSLQQIPIELAKLESSSKFSQENLNHMYFHKHPAGDKRVDIENLKSEVNRLGAELEVANKQIRKLSLDRRLHAKNSEDLLQDAPASMSQEWMQKWDLAQANNSEALKKFSVLFSHDRAEIMNELNKLPELTISDELQAKIVFSVVVLSFRSVQDSIESEKKKVWKALQISGATERSCGSSLTEFESAFLRFLSQRAKSENGMQNAKDVTSKIWHTLYDFPSLKTCTRFNRFILDCVQVAWDLTAGAQPDEPRYQLEFESKTFSPDRHFRFHSSSLRSDTIKRYVWPGLISIDQTDKSDSDSAGIVVFKGVVIT